MIKEWHDNLHAKILLHALVLHSLHATLHHCGPKENNSVSASAVTFAHHYLRAFTYCIGANAHSIDQRDKHPCWSHILLQLSSKMSSVKSLVGKVCIVTGATRGIGRGIALQLGEAGAKVYITGRTLHAKENHSVGGSLEETAAEIKKRGGEAFPVQCDHSKDEEVKKLFQQVASEQDGQLDILVNNAYAAVNAIMTNYGKPFWEQDEDLWDTVNIVGLRNHYLCSVEAAKLMVPRKQGLIINISSFGGLTYLLNIPYGVGKAGCDRMAADCSIELRKHNVAFISLWPGAVQTENVMHIMDQNIIKDEAASKKLKTLFENGETTEFAGKCVVALAIDDKIMDKSGRVLTTGDMAEEYSLMDINGKPVMNTRRVKTLLELSKHPWLSAITPSFLKVPQWMVALMSNRFATPRNMESTM